MRKKRGKKGEDKVMATEDTKRKKKALARGETSQEEREGKVEILVGMRD